MKSIVHEARAMDGTYICVVFFSLVSDCIVYSPKAIFKSNKNIANTNMFVRLELLPFWMVSETDG